MIGRTLQPTIDGSTLRTVPTRPIHKVARRAFAIEHCEVLNPAYNSQRTRDDSLAAAEREPPTSERLRFGASTTPLRPAMRMLTANQSASPRRVGGAEPDAFRAVPRSQIRLP